MSQLPTKNGQGGFESWLGGLLNGQGGSGGSGFDFNGMLGGVGKMLSGILGQVPGIGPILGPIFSIVFGLSGMVNQPPEQIIESMKELVGAAKLTAEGDPTALDAMVTDWQNRGKIDFANDQQEAEFRTALKEGMVGALEDGTITPEELTAIQTELATISIDAEGNPTIDMSDRVMGSELLYQERVEGDGVSYSQTVDIGNGGIPSDLFKESFSAYSVDADGNQLYVGETSITDLTGQMGNDMTLQAMNNEDGSIIGYYISDKSDGMGVYVEAGPETLKLSDLNPAAAAQLSQPETQVPDYATSPDNSLNMGDDVDPDNDRSLQFSVFGPAA